MTKISRVPSDRCYVVTLSCPHRVGIVAAVSNFIANYNGLILEVQHHADRAKLRFFMRQKIIADSLAFNLE